MGILKNVTAATMATHLGNRIGKLRYLVTIEPENLNLLKKLKESQKIYVILAREAYYSII